MHDVIVMHSSNFYSTIYSTKNNFYQIYADGPVGMSRLKPFIGGDTSGSSWGACIGVGPDISKSKASSPDDEWASILTVCSSMATGRGAAAMVPPVTSLIALAGAVSYIVQTAYSILRRYLMNKASLSDLLAQKAALEKQIADFQKEQRGEAISKVKALMAEYGLTLADIGSKPAPVVSVAPKKASVKVAAKYRNPATGDTWSGRGLKPKWLAAALADGKSLTDFAL